MAQGGVAGPLDRRSSVASIARTQAVAWRALTSTTSGTDEHGGTAQERRRRGPARCVPPTSTGGEDQQAPERVRADAAWPAWRPRPRRTPPAGGCARVARPGSPTSDIHRARADIISTPLGAAIDAAVDGHGRAGDHDADVRPPGACPASTQRARRPTRRPRPAGRSRSASRRARWRRRRAAPRCRSRRRTAGGSGPAPLATTRRSVARGRADAVAVLGVAAGPGTPGGRRRRCRAGTAQPGSGATGGVDGVDGPLAAGRCRGAVGVVVLVDAAERRDHQHPDREQPAQSEEQQCAPGETVARSIPGSAQRAGWSTSTCWLIDCPPGCRAASPRPGSADR